MAAAHWIWAARAALAAGAAAALLACASDPGGVQFASEGVGLTSVDGLRRVENWGFSLAFVKPGANLTRYQKAIISGVTIVYKEPSHPARTTRDGIESGTYLLSPYAAKRMKRYLQKALVAEFGKSDAFAVTEQPTPDAIRVTAYILDLVVRTPPGQGVGNAYTNFLANRGEFVLVLDVRDARSGAPLLRVADHSLIKFDGAHAYIPANPATNAMALRLIFRQAATRLRQNLDYAYTLREIPPAPTLTRNGG